jgi:phosphoserine aminotransferase
VTEPGPSDIRIPASLLPSDGRFGPGPSKVRQTAVEALAKCGPEYLGTSHRQAGVRSVVGRLRAGLAELFSLSDDYEVALGNGGATAFWDVAVFCLIERRSQHLVFGEFSSKFAACAASAPHLGDPDVIEASAGTHPSVVARPEVDVYALTQNETSTGVAMEIRRPVGDGVGDSALVAVDATSAAGGVRFDPSQVDAYYFSPQKCFGADGGLWVAVLSPAATDRAERLARNGRWAPPSLDLGLALANSRLDQTYNTPALATLFLCVEQVEWMLAGGGLEWSAGRCDRSAEHLYGWAEASDYAQPFVSDPAKRSPVVGTVDLEASVDAAAVSRVLRANGIVDTEPYRKLNRNQLRVAMFPAIDPDDVAALTACVDYVVERLA